MVLGILTFSDIADHAARNWVGIDPSAAVFDMFLRDGAILLHNEAGLGDEDLQSSRRRVCVQETERGISSRLQTQVDHLLTSDNHNLCAHRRRSHRSRSEGEGILRRAVGKVWIVVSS